jgi:hypothetical protein
MLLTELAGAIGNPVTPPPESGATASAFHCRC